MVELFPCPFCGGSASIEQYGDWRQSTIYSCNDCSCRLETGEEWHHGRHWNDRAALASHTSALAERDAEVARLKAENKRFGRALELIASAVSWVLDEDLNRPVEVAMDEEEMANIARGALQPVELPHV